MQKKNLVDTEHNQSVSHEVRGLALHSRWVVDSKPLKPGKYSVIAAHTGSDTGGCSAAPAVKKKN